MNTVKKKILYVITKSDFGGAQKYVADLASMSAKEGCEIIVAHGKNNFVDSSMFDRILQEAGARIIHIKSLNRDVHFFSDTKVFFELIRLFRKWSPDIVHLNSSKIGALGALAARIAGCPRIIYTTHGLPHMEPRPRWQRITIKFITWFTFLLSHKVIVVSDKELHEVSKWFGVKNKVVRIYNGVDAVEYFSQEEARKIISSRIGIPLENTCVIGSIAELTKNKGLIEFLPILSQLKENNPNFIYIHFGDGELKDALEKETRRHNLQDAVYWLGFDENASKYLKALDIFTLPSLKEGLPYTLLEAGSVGLAVVASEVGGIPEILGEDRGVLTPVNNEELFVNELEILVTDSEKRKELGSNLKQYVASTFTKTAMFQKTKELYFKD
ncbi:glycosyltransferase family 4 protein [Candidatus Kaiserbacteria bacterium]|nr:MAG: glycosyltransferase family 4 protein [Candidatus Kaiserbacteria bacterium]